MTDRVNRDVSRRDILKGVGGAAGASGLTTLAGCLGGGSGGGAGAGDGGGGGTEGDGSSGGGDSGGGSTAKVLFWTDYFSDKQDDPWEKWYKSTYEERNPNADLTVSSFTYMDRRQKFLTGARQGNPDLIEGVLSHLSEFQKADLLEPLTEDAESLDYWDGFIPGAKDAMTYKGEVWGLPFVGNGRALIYRKDVFDELGLEPPKTAAEFHEVGRAINEQRDDMIAFHNCTKEGSVRAFQEWISHVYQHEDNLYTIEGDSWKLVPSAETLGTVFDNWYYQVYASDNPIGNPDQLGTGWQVNDPGYLNGDFAMIECGPWLRSWTSGENIDNPDKTTKLLNEKTAVTHLPYDSSASKGTYLEVKPVMVNKHSKNKKAAWKAAQQFVSLESFKEMKKAGLTGDLATPLHEDISSTLTQEDWKPFQEVIKTGRPLAKIKWGPVRTAFYKEMQQVAYGKKDPMKAGEDFHGTLSDLTSDMTV